MPAENFPLSSFNTSFGVSYLPVMRLWATWPVHSTVLTVGAIDRSNADPSMHRETPTTGTVVPELACFHSGYLHLKCKI